MLPNLVIIENAVFEDCFLETFLDNVVLGNFSHQISQVPLFLNVVLYIDEEVLSRGSCHIDLLKYKIKLTFMSIANQLILSKIQIKWSHEFTSKNMKRYLDIKQWSLLSLSGPSCRDPYLRSQTEGHSLLWNEIFAALIDWQEQAQAGRSHRDL